jgi:acid phosphatase (class A)
MRASRALTTIASTVLLCAWASATQAGSPAPASATLDPPVPSGYIAADALDILRILPPAPRNGDARDEADRRVFRETRKMLGSPRWDMASADADLSTPQLLHHFACSLDIELTPAEVPALTAMLQKAADDTGRATGKAKDYYQRKRPYWVDKGPICRPRAELGMTFDYPSGHATLGWAWAMVLAQVAPEQATLIFERGRVIGESRVVCGVHNASAVDASRLLVNAMLTLAMATPAYQADMVSARQELTALRSQPHVKPEPARCAAETKLMAVPVVP